MDLVSAVVGFLIGVATGAAGSYYGTKFTEQRHRKEGEHVLRALCRELDGKMPELFDEIRKDLTLPDNALKREFFLLKRSWTFKASGPYLCYYYDDHANLDDKIALLEDEGLVTDVTEKNVKKYRLSADLVTYLTQ